MRRAVEGEDFTAYNEGWMVDCEVVIWRSGDGTRHETCQFQCWAKRKADAVKEMRQHIRDQHREDL